MHHTGAHDQVASGDCHFPVMDNKALDEAVTFDYIYTVLGSLPTQYSLYRGGGEAALLPFEAHSNVRLFFSGGAPAWCAGTPRWCVQR